MRLSGKGASLPLCALLTLCASPVVAAVQASARPPAFQLAFEAAPAASRGAFVARGPGFTLALDPTRAALTVAGDRRPVRARSLEWHWRGANPRAAGVLLEATGAQSHYLLGNDPRRWRSGVPLYARLRYRDVYPGADLVYYGNSNRLEYDFVLRPGADPAAIGWSFEGAGSARIDGQGDLVVGLGPGRVVLHRPLAWQQTEGRREAVEVSFIEPARGVFGFRLGPYDRARELTIDPTISFAALFGGSGSEYPGGLALDASGQVIIAGSTDSADLAVLAPYQGSRNGINTDLFIARFSADGGTLLSSTYFGGSDDDYASAVQTDAAGNIYVAGYTYSTDLPTRAAAQPSAGGNQDAFLAKLNPSGSTLVLSTYLGGSGDDFPYALSVEAVSGSVAVGGSTYGSDFPVSVGTVPANDTEKAFAAVYSAAGIRSYSTVLADESSSVQGASLASSGALWIAGYTSLSTFPTTSGAFQTTHGGCSDAYLAKLKADGSGMLYSTLFGGAHCEYALALAVDSAGNVAIGGSAEEGLPLKPLSTPLQSTYGGSGDGFVARFDAGGSLLWSTYLGGGSGDSVAALAADDIWTVHYNM